MDLLNQYNLSALSGLSSAEIKWTIVSGLLCTVRQTATQSFPYDFIERVH